MNENRQYTVWPETAPQDGHTMLLQRGENLKMFHVGIRNER